VKLIPNKPSKPVNADDNLGRGMDLALVTLVFLGLGYALDRWFDTKPVFMISFVLLALIGQFVKMWYTYDAAMSDHERKRVDAAHQHQDRAA
jgi:F0F1-type ATP synthase assembly protein I